MLDTAIDEGHISVNPTKKKLTVKAPTSSEVRAQKPEIITWTGEQLNAFLHWTGLSSGMSFSLSGGSSPTPGCVEARRWPCGVR